MPGQFATRRGAGGRLEKVPEAEQGALQAASEGITPPAGGSVTQEDIAFVDGPGGLMQSQEGPPPVQPPPLPPKSTPAQPPPLPPAAPQEESGVADAAKSVIGGAVTGGVAGATAAAGLLLANKAAENQATKVSSLEGAKSGQSDGGQTLKDLLSVTQQIARFGSPIKGAVTTNPANSRIG